MKTITMQLVKINKTLVEYAELDGDLQPVRKPVLSPIYIRKGEWEVNGELPMNFTVVLTPAYAESK
jgi:hypothetical protein